MTIMITHMCSSVYKKKSACGFSYFIMLVDGVEDDQSGVAGDLELRLTDGGAVVDEYHHVLRLRPHR